MKKLRRILQACQVDRLLVIAFFVGAMLVHAPDCRSQDSPPPPSLSPIPPPPAQLPSPLKMQPLNTLPGQANARANQAGQAGQAAGGTAPVFAPQASASTSAVSQRAFAPNMIGDGFGPQPFTVMLGRVGDQKQLNVTLPGTGGTVGTSKIAENSSPIPRDRVYFNYSDFNGVPLLVNGVNVNRFTPGFEKTFFDGMASIEVRTPFASTLSNNLFALDSNNTSSMQFGDLTIYLKQLLYKSETLAVSGGLGLALPTAGNVNVFGTPNQQLLTVKDQSVHLLPFLGSVYSPTEQFFVQHFLQFDFDTTGNTVETRNFDGRMSTAGRLNDMTYLYYSVGAGYWLYNNPESDRLFTRIAPIVELHYNKSLTSTDTVNTPSFNVGSPGINQDLLNGTIGMTAMMGRDKTLTLAYVTPLSSIDHRQFNSEFRLMFNWFFGGSTNRFTRVQF